MEAKYYEISEDMSQRLNILKFIFMAMVVFIHSEALPVLPYELEVPEYVSVCKNIATYGICAIAVPGFFFVSGFLLFSKEFTWIENLKKKARSLLLPYFLINTFWILFFKGMQHFNATAPYFAGENYQVNGIRGLLEAYLNPMPLYYPFWFLRELIILNLFAKTIKIIIDRMPVISFVMIIAIYFNIVQIPLLLSNDSFCIFSLSYYLVKYQWNVKKIDRVRCLHWGLAFGGAIAFKLWIWNHAITRLCYVAIGLCFFWQLAGRIRKGRLCKPILWCSQFSFFIYAFHEFFEAMLKKVVMTTLPQYGYVQLMEFFLIPTFIIAICIVAGAVTKKWIPAIYRLICGYR